MSKKRARELFSDLMEKYDETPAGVLVPTTAEYSDDFDIVGLMNSAKDPDTGLMRDLKIEDGDLRHASSFYDYCFNVIKGDAHPPWMMQMWISVMLFAEYCPACSDKRWLNIEYVTDKIDCGAPSEGIVEHLKMLKHGVCPKCKRTKHELIKNHGLRNYVELVNVLGQRSGKSALAANMATYVTHRYLKFPKLATLTRAMQKSTELTGTFVSLNFNKAFSLLWTPYINIINEASWWCLAEGTPITMASGERTLIQNVQVGSTVKTLEGEHEVTNVFVNGVQECFALDLDNSSTLVGTKEHQVRCLAADGETLVWKHIGDIVEGDLVVVE